jgi:HEAT repeat protein
MVKVMPIQNPIPALRTAPRALMPGVISAFLLLSSAGATYGAPEDAPSGGGLPSMFSTYGIVIILVAGLVGLLVYRKVRTKQKAHKVGAHPHRRNSRGEQSPEVTNADATREPSMIEERRIQTLQPAQQWEKPGVEASVFGAYRIDQEVGKLVLGKPHRMDVMASRASDDRRAIEASLVKALEASDTTDDERRRVRQALEEYGFVARQSATMLMGRDAWERSSAARALGQIGSESSLSFLIEALHDADPVVRNQAITSLGALKLPAAIGALLDIARRHPDIPASLLSETLSSCSVESLGYLDSLTTEPDPFGDGSHGRAAGDESLVNFEDLPAGTEDQTLAELLAQLESEDENVRTQVAQQLGLYPVQCSVSALSTLALKDEDSAVRAAAVVSLGSIDHESVFAPVLIALSDETREVRAAAARTLTGLHFDRAEAYVRVMEKADAETLHNVAEACIKIGIVSQTADRLASEDRRQAYEAFSLFSLLAKANQTDPILDTIRSHKDTEVRLCAVRVLSVAAGSDVTPKLRDLVALKGVPESVRTAMLEVLYKLDQKQAVFEMTPNDNDGVTLHNSL